MWIRFTGSGLLKGVELLVQRESRLGSFVTKVVPSLKGEDQCFMNSVTGYHFAEQSALSFRKNAVS